MRIAFYAPLKPPTAAVPSGDREMALQIITALKLAGHETVLASVFRSWDGAGDRHRQTRLKLLGNRLADRLVRRYGARSPAQRPSAWFTYHLYHKAPDWIGPRVSDALGIPYVVAEASFAPKQEGGNWALGHAAAASAIRRADAVISLNSRDSACVRPLLDDPARLTSMAPFTNVAPFASAADDRARHRRALIREYDLDPEADLLLAVAMMRVGDKLESYRVLARALAKLQDRPWQLLVVGDGAARPEVERSLASLGGKRVRYAGLQPADGLPRFYAASDVLVWPAIREAYGMAVVEAQAAALPVVAGDAGGVGDIVVDGSTGLLTKEGDVTAFAGAVAVLLDDAARRARLGAAARRRAAANHSLESASKRLDSVLAGLVAEPVR